MELNQYESCFNRGLKAFAHEDYETARKKFNISSQHLKFRDKSLVMLARIGLKQGNYQYSRSILESFPNPNNLEHLKVFSKLERLEYNLNASTEYLNILMQTPRNQYSALYELAINHIQLGNYDMAQSMLETLQLRESYFFMATLNLAYLNILKHNFFEALRLMQLIDSTTLDKKLSRYYGNALMYIRYYLGDIKIEERKHIDKDSYMLERLFSNSDYPLIDHIARHVSNSKNENGFTKEVNIKEMLEEIQREIENMNGIHTELTDIYRLKLDKQVGFIDTLPTNEVCCVCITGTTDIITTYPAIFSEQFDKEGMSTSKELKLKRMKGEF